MAGRPDPGPLAPALHADQLELAQPRRALVHGAHRPPAAPWSVRQRQALIEAIDFWTEHWNDDPKPFIWHKAADEIIEKVRRGRAALHQIKTATGH